MVVYNSKEFDIGHCSIKMSARYTTIQTILSPISQLWHWIEICNKICVSQLWVMIGNQNSAVMFVFHL